MTSEATIQAKIVKYRLKMGQLAQKIKQLERRLARNATSPIPNSSPTESMPTNTHTRMLSTTLDDDWGASKGAIKSAKRLEPGSDELTLTLPAGGHGSAGGVNLKCVPKGFPCTSAELMYSVYIPKKWECVKGGKLPGLYIGKQGTGGKSYEKDNGSARLMWRKNNQLVSYLYLCTDQGDITKQGPEFLHACNNKFPDAGIDMWRETKDKLILKEGSWNTITYGIQLNEKGKKNGRLWLELNGKRLSVNDACFTARPDTIKIGGMQFSCWYGGSNVSWAPKKDQMLMFKDISVSVLG